MKPWLEAMRCWGHHDICDTGWSTLLQIVDKCEDQELVEQYRLETKDWRRFFRERPCGCVEGRDF